MGVFVQALTTQVYTPQGVVKQCTPQGGTEKSKSKVEDNKNSGIGIYIFSKEILTKHNKFDVFVNIAKTEVVISGHQRFGRR